MKERLYHIVSIREKDGRKTYLTGYPMVHKECMTMKSKNSYHPSRRLQLEEVEQIISIVRLEDCTVGRIYGRVKIGEFWNVEYQDENGNMKRRRGVVAEILEEHPY